jgi:hypothetical protein
MIEQLRWELNRGAQLAADLEELLAAELEGRTHSGDQTAST